MAVELKIGARVRIKRLIQSENESKGFVELMREKYVGKEGVISAIYKEKDYKYHVEGISIGLRREELELVGDWVEEWQ